MFKKLMGAINPQPYGTAQEELPADFSTEIFMDKKYREDIVSILAGLLGTQTEGTNFFVGMGGGIHDIVWSVFDTEKTAYKGVVYPEDLVKMLEGVDRSGLSGKEASILQAFEKLLESGHGITVERSENKKKVVDIIGG